MSRAKEVITIMNVEGDYVQKFLKNSESQEITPKIKYKTGEEMVEYLRKYPTSHVDLICAQMRHEPKELLECLSANVKHYRKQEEEFKEELSRHENIKKYGKMYLQFLADMIEVLETI